MSWLYDLDLGLFRFCNATLANPFGDFVFPFLSDIHNFYLLYGLGIVALLLTDGKRGRIAVVLLLVMIVVSDQFSSALIKPLVGRVRPCAALDHVRLLVGCGGGKSFPSSHAVNNFAMAWLMSRLYRKAAWYLFVFAALVAFSRVYVGVHYPADVLGGAAIGVLLAWALLWLYRAVDGIAVRRNSTFFSLPQGTVHG
jgi:undecaprenyl-diphosphatase